MNFPQLIDQLSQQDTLEWLGLLTGIVYVVLAAYARPACWIFGIISAACIGWKSLTDYYLIADAILQLFYIVIGVIGLWHWRKGQVGALKKPIIVTPLVRHLQVIAAGLLLSWPISWLLIHYADARYGYLDTLLTLLSIWATFMLIRKDLHNWIFWIVIDLVYILIYWASEGYLFAVLFLIYAMVSIWGFNLWKRDMKDEKYIRNIDGL